MWKSFIESIKNLFETDDLVEIKPNYLIFKAGEHPRLPFEGHKFLSFRSKLTRNEGIDRYIDTVTRAARAVFGSRIHVWNDAADQLGYYDWAQVLRSIKSYTQPDESGIPDSSARIGCETDPASVNELDLPLFEIRELPGKGKGLIARCNIAKGTRILVEKPLFTIRKVSSISQLDRSIATKLRALSKIEQRQFLMLHNNFPGKHAFSGVIRTNALPCGSNSRYGA
ncbi:MAG: hypothetical protein M1825_004894 [Sarcosagium campestre]|nr:MAG: hypothetical protein M1825_004894 [Sarcosagium campestre]